MGPHFPKANALPSSCHNHKEEREMETKSGTQCVMFFSRTETAGEGEGRQVKAHMPKGGNLTDSIMSIIVMISLE